MHEAQAVDPTTMLRVLRALAQSPGLTRAQIAGRVGSSRPTVSAALRLLEDRGFLEQRIASDAAERRTGRPPMRVFLAGSAASSVGLEITRTELHAGVFDISGRVLAELRTPLRGAVPLDDAAALVRELVHETSGATAYVLGVGVAVAAPVDRDGRVVDDVVPDGWDGVDLARELAERLELPVAVENDANAAALAEHRFGAGRHCSELLYLRLSPGVGAGLILGDRLYRGAHGIAGELGHVTVDPAGALCSCGSRGCLETIAGTLALEDELRGVRRGVTLAERDDRHVRRLLADAGLAIGAAIATAVNLLDPARVVVGGELADAGPVLFDAIDQGLARDALVPALARTEVVAGTVGPRAPVLGAASALMTRELEALVNPASVL
jgi:predicted NBD/HSP70 family sugar kinase